MVGKITENKDRRSRPQRRARSTVQRQGWSLTGGRPRRPSAKRVTSEGLRAFTGSYKAQNLGRGPQHGTY